MIREVSLQKDKPVNTEVNIVLTGANRGMAVCKGLGMHLLQGRTQR